MALPHVDAILAHHNDDQVWLLTGPSFSELFTNHPRLRTVVLDRRRQFGSTSTLGRILWVRDMDFAAVYDLQGNRTSRLLVRFSKAPRRVGTQPKSIYNHHPEFAYTKETQQNVFDRLNQTLSSAGLPRADARCLLYPSPADIELVNDWKKAHSLEAGRYALLHAGSSIEWLSKRWDKENYLLLALALEKKGLRCVWVGSGDDRIVNTILSQEVGIDATDKFSMLQLYLLGKEARLGVTNDSGPMHILAASGLPVYSFFGPTSWIRSHAMGQRERVFRTEADCSPCFKGLCPPEKKHHCLSLITAEQVIERIAVDLYLYR